MNKARNEGGKEGQKEEPKSEPKVHKPKGVTRGAKEQIMDGKINKISQLMHKCIINQYIICILFYCMGFF